MCAPFGTGTELGTRRSGWSTLVGNKTCCDKVNCGQVMTRRAPAQMIDHQLSCLGCGFPFIEATLLLSPALSTDEEGVIF